MWLDLLRLGLGCTSVLYFMTNINVTIMKNTKGKSARLVATSAEKPAFLNQQWCKLVQPIGGASFIPLLCVKPCILGWNGVRVIWPQITKLVGSTNFFEFRCPTWEHGDWGRCGNVCISEGQGSSFDVVVVVVR